MSNNSTTLAKVTPPFVLLSAALLLWSGAVTLSSHLARAPEDLSHGRGGAARMGSPSAGERGGLEGKDLPESIKVLQRAVEAAPSDVNARLAFARALREEAYAKEDGELLMQTVRAFGEVLDVDKENPEALLALAALCLEAGIIDKALTLYPRYLAQRPDDWHAKVDYALALLHADRAKDALPILDSVAQSQPELFQVRFAQALAYKLSGDLNAARAAAAEAGKRAPNEEAKQRLQQFIEALDHPPSVAPEESGVVAAVGRSGPQKEALAPESLSPARLVASFFEQHPIVAPKLRGIRWPELNRAEVSLDNFPVEQMPEFARAKFLGSAKAHMKILPSKVTIVLVDAASKRELLTFEVGEGIDAN